MKNQKAILRTRSQANVQAALVWTIEESLILVNEIAAVEAECSNTLSSFQKWKIIVENCNALDLNRSSDQCKKKWNSLLDEYKKIKRKNGVVENFDADLFKAVDDCVRARDDRSDTDPDNDPGNDEDDEETEDDLLVNVIAKSVSPPLRKLKRKIVPQKRPLEDWGARRKNSKSEKKTTKLCRSKEKVECPKESARVKLMPEESSREEKVERMTAELLKATKEINTVLEGEFVEEADCKLGDLSTAKAVQTVIARRKGDELIACFGNYTNTLDQLCQILQQSS